MNPYVLKQPVVTEKSLNMARSLNVYTFEVDRTSTKDQIKAAVEKTFSVNVLAVNTILGRRIAKNTGKKRMKSVTAPTKKALVTLKEGQTINLFEFDRE